MGSKPSKALYDIMDKLLPQSQSQSFELTLATLCEKPMADCLKDRVLTKIFKPADLQAFLNNMRLNIPQDLYTEERETKKRKYRELLQQSLLVAGHERHPQMDSTLHALEESPPLRLEPAISFANVCVRDFVCLQLFLRTLHNSRETSPSFEAKLAKCLKGEPGTDTAESAGASAALSFTSLLLDPKQISQEPQILAQALQLFRDIPALSLYGWTRQAVVIEQSIGKVKACLLYLIENERSELLQGAILTLCYIGLACGSIENLLLGVLYAQTKKVEIPSHAIAEVVERIESLPGGLTSLYSRIPELDLCGALEKVPFEQLYLGVGKDSKGDEEHSLSACTNGEFVFVFSEIHGVLSLGAGKNRIHGKVYECAKVEEKGPIRLVSINRKLYAFTKGQQQLFKLNPQTGKLKPSKKGSLIPKFESICATKGYVVGYSKIETPKDKEGCFGEVTYFDLKHREITKKYTVDHSLAEVREIIACGDLVILVGKDGKYIMIDLPHSKKLKEGELLARGTLCVNQFTGELYAIFAESPKDGLVMARLKSLPLHDAQSELSAEKLLSESKPDEAKLKREVASLLGFYVPPQKQVQAGPEEMGEKKGQSWNKLLEILVARAKQGVRSSDLERPEEVFGAFKAPLGVQLSGKCFETLIDLTEHFMGKAKIEPNVWVPNAVMMLDLLHLHILGLKRCELNLSECTGKGVAQKCFGFLQNTVKPLLAEPSNFLPAAVDPKLKQKLLTICETLMASASVLLVDNSMSVVAKARDTLRSLLAGTKPDPGTHENIAAAATWLDVQKNQQLIAGKVMEKDSLALDLLDAYFSVEETYLTCKVEEFLSKHSPGLWIFQGVKDALGPGIRGTMEKLILLVFTNLKEKQWDTQEVVAHHVFPLLLPRINNMVTTIKDGYTKFKKSLLSAGGDEENQQLFQRRVGVEYFSYWRFLDGPVRNDLLAFCSLNLLTTSLLGFQMLPEQSFHIVQSMLIPVKAIKELVSILRKDKAFLGTKKPFERLQKVYKIAPGAIAKGVTVEKVFEFEGANAVRIKTIEDADFPPPATNSVSILDARTGNRLGTISRENPRFSQCVNSSSVKLTAKIVNEVYKDTEYEGCKIMLRPKYKYGQNALKEMLRKLTWTACFLCKSAISYFDYRTPGVTKSQAELISTLVSSRLFSGGLGADSMKALCSSTFNQQLAKIVHEAKVQAEAAQIFPAEEASNSLGKIYSGTHPAFDAVISRIHDQSRAYTVTKDTLSNDMVKAVFALLLQVNDAGQDFLQFTDPAPLQSSTKEQRVVSLYSQANQMRVWLMEKKQVVANTAGEEGFEKRWHEVVQRIYAKIKLLHRFKYANLLMQAHGTRTSAKLVRGQQQENAGLSETELVRTRLSHWKDVQISVRRDGAELSLSAATIELLQSDISTETVLAELEKCYLRGMTIYGTVAACNELFKEVPSTSAQIDIVTWLTSMLRRADTMNWAHSDALTVCGAVYQRLLRGQFFGFVQDMLGYMNAAKGSASMSCFFEALRWNFLPADHGYLRKEAQLFTKLGGESKTALLSSLWGKELESEDHLPEILLDAFEYIVIRIALRGLAVLPESKSEDASPSSPVRLDDTAGLVQEIVQILIKELEKAARSYEDSSGIDAVVATKYADTSRAVGKEDEGKSSVDKRKVKALFMEGSKEIYSSDFCIRILRLLYHICVAANNDPTGKAYIRLIFKQTDLAALMKLLDVGSSHQQFLILQTIPYLVPLAYQNLETAAQKHLGENSPRYSQSHILDALFAFALARREGIWTKERASKSLGYALSKCVVRVLQSSLSTQNELGEALRPLLRTIIFGTPTEVRALPAPSQRKAFLELALSVAGGEFESLHKGAVGFTREKKEFAVVAFASLRLDPTKDAVCEWEFSPRVHDEVMVHLVNEEGAGAVHQMPAYELVPSAHIPGYDEVARDVRAEDVVGLLHKMLNRSKAITNDTLSETLKVKLLKVVMLLLKSQKTLSKAVFSEELVVLLLGTALQYPKIDTSKSLLMAELAAEEMRKRASQADFKALRHNENVRNCVVRKGSKLLFTGPGVKFAVRVYAHLNIDKLRPGVPYEYLKYSPEDAKNAEGKILFVDKEMTPAQMEETAKTCQGVVLPMKLYGLMSEVKEGSSIVLMAIADKDMNCLDRIVREVEEIGHKMATLNPETIMADYMNIPPAKKEVKANTLKGILQELIASEKKNVARKFKSQNEILDILLTQSERRASIFREGQDNSITEERASYSKEYAMLFKQVHEQGEEATPESYASLLHDLHVFYARHMLLRLLIRNQEKIISFPVELYKKLLTFLLISAAEADLMKYAVQHKTLSKRLNKLLLATLKRPDSVDVFIKWTHERVMDTVYCGRVLSYSISSTPQSKLEEGIYLPFICRYMKAILRFKNETLMTNKGIGMLMDEMMGVVIVAEKAAEKYRAISLVRKIIGSAAKLLNELPAAAIERILGCQSLKALAQYFNKTERKNSVIWRTANEILMKANVVYRYATALHGEVVQTYYTKNAFNLFIASEVMKEFPKLTLATTYVWGKQIRKELKGKETLRIATPSPLFDTQYCVLVSDIRAHSLQVQSKKASHRVAMVSIDRDGCAELPSIEGEESKFLVEGNRFYLHFPCDTFSTFAMGINDGGQLGLKEIKSADEPKIIPELAGTQIKAFVSGNKHTAAVSTKDVILSTGKGEGRLGTDSLLFSPYKPHLGSSCIATNGVATMFFDQKSGSLYVTGKNPERMFGPEAGVLTNEEPIKPQEQSVTQVSVSSNHVVVLYNERQLYGCPASKKELFGTFAEKGETSFLLVKFGEEIDKIYKVLAVGCGTIILCMSRISGHRELYSFGLMDSPILGQTDHQLSDEYGRLEYPEYDLYVHPGSRTVEFVDLTGNEQMAAAVTSTGELYTWGCGPLGIFTDEGLALELADRPTQVLALVGFTVLEVSVGSSHILALVADPAEPGKRRVFGFGDNSKGQLGKKTAEFGWTELEFFGNKKPYKVCAGNETSFVCCGEEVKGVLHRDTTCCLTGVSPIKDILFFRPEPKLKFWSRDCLDQLPDLVFATRNPIANIHDKPWPNFAELKSGPAISSLVVTCTECKQQIPGDSAVYRSAITESPGTSFCESCFFKTPTSFQAMIYYRVAKSGNMPAELPLLSLGRIYEVATDSLIISVNSVYKYEFPKAFVAGAVKPALADFLDEFKAFEYQNDLDVLDVLNDCFMEKDIKIEGLSSKAELPLNFVSFFLKSGLEKEDGIKEILRRTAAT